MDQIVTVGRRKTSKARVFLAKGSGLITVNKKKLDDYFGREVARMVVRLNLVLLGPLWNMMKVSKWL